MLREALCMTCRRTVYRGEGEDAACPVCSSPLFITQDVAHVVEDAGPASEAARLQAVRRYEILDTPPDGAFDRIAALAARLLRTPIATMAIVDTDRVWFKAKHGVDATAVDRGPGLCASAIMQYEPLIVEDASLDSAALHNKLVTGELGLRFYAGVPLTTADGYNLGTLNVIDVEPRTIAQEETESLRDLATIVMDELELRLAARRLYRRAAESGVDLSA
jgi:GAF domain-containing protein